MGRPQRIHNLRTNEGERTPRRLFVFDTETDWQELEGRELHQLRLWAGAQVTRYPGTERPPLVVETWGRTGPELAEAAEGFTRSTVSTWAYAHNLSFDLTTTRLPLELMERGWKLGQNNLASDAPWARLERSGRRLRLADSFSWLPVSIARLGELMGLSKPDLPHTHDLEQDWLARCRADVAILTLALCRLMDEWDRRQLGVWSLTGPASGWNCLLHLTPRRARHRVGQQAHAAGGDRLGPAVAPAVIDPDPEARAFERLGLYSGRRDAWRFGRLAPDHFLELDFRTAHLAIAAQLPLPIRRTRAFDQLTPSDWRWRNPLVSMVARCRVRTESPRYPVRWRGAILHPVGEFDTVLCGPELREARERGDLVSVGHGYGYLVDYFMRPWARWALERLDESRPDFDPLFATMVKGWSRSVPGRWAMLTSETRDRRPHPMLGWHVEPAAFDWPPRKGLIAYLGGERLEIVRDVEAEDGFPAVLAHIQSWDRLLMQRMIDTLGESNLVSVNTDSAIVAAARVVELGREAATDELDAGDQGAYLRWGELVVSAATAPLVARVKRESRGGLILSAQHREFGGERVMAGIPRTAEELEPGRYRFHTWPKLKGQMERGDPRGYVRELREVDLRGVRPLRWVYECGCCEPLRAAQRPGEAFSVSGPASGFCGRHGAALALQQHSLLRGVEW